MTDGEALRLFLRNVIHNTGRDHWTVQKLLVLLVLHQQGEARLSTLQEWVMMSKSSMSRLMRELQERGLVRVYLDPEHGSRRLCALTDPGLDLTHLLLKPRDQLESEEHPQLKD